MSPNENNIRFLESKKKYYQKAYDVLLFIGDQIGASRSFDDYCQCFYTLNELGCDYAIPEKPEWYIEE